MELGGVDASGRPRPIKVPGSEFTLEIDSLIPAIGQKVDLDFFPHDELRIDPETLETQISGVFAGGDASRGASSLIKAIGDGQKAAAGHHGQGRAGGPRRSPSRGPGAGLGRAQAKAGPQARSRPGAGKGTGERLDFEPFVAPLDNDTAQAEASRCLHCDIFCNVCTHGLPQPGQPGLEMGRDQLSIAKRQPGKGQVHFNPGQGRIQPKAPDS
jgi:putative selenate reductase